jgi:RimJ/RimL family protein N-acetyltransferase
MDLSGLEIETDRLRLRAYRNSDAQEIFEAMTPEVARYMSFEPSRDVDEILSLGRVWTINQQAGREVSVVIRRDEDGRFVGMCGLHYRDDPVPEVGIWIRADAHRQGFGRESVGAIVRYAGAVLGETSVVYPVVAENTPSRRVAESLGGELFDRRTMTKPSGVTYEMVVYRVSTA